MKTRWQARRGAKIAIDQTQPSKKTSYPVIDSATKANQYVKDPAKNKALFWSGIKSEYVQQFAIELGLQTLEQLVGPEILSHPKAHDRATSSIFWTHISAAFADHITTSGSTEIAIILKAPNRILTAPSDPSTDGRLADFSDAFRIEIPRMQSANIKVMAMHPAVSGPAGRDKYELCPTDEGHKWQQRWNHDPSAPVNMLALNSQRRSPRIEKRRRRLEEKAISHTYHIIS